MLNLRYSLITFTHHSRDMSAMKMANNETAGLGASASVLERPRPGMVSIVVPAFNEEACLQPLYDELLVALARIERPYQIIFVNDGSTDGSKAVLEALAQRDENVTAINLRRNCGKSAALDAGFRWASGEFIITMDADLQDDPAEISRFIAELEKNNDLVNGWKKHRLDPLSKTVPSKLFNAFTSFVSGLPLHDFNCGFKAYRREAIQDLRLYGEFHRFIPALVRWNGFKVVEMEVNHRRRFAGHSKFGARRLLNGAFDLLTVMLTARFRSRPLHFFGYIAAFFGIIGASMLMWLFATSMFGFDHLRPRPMLYGSIVLVIVSAVFVSAGLLGELIKSFHTDAVDYQVSSVVSKSARNEQN